MLFDTIIIDDHPIASFGTETYLNAFSAVRHVSTFDASVELRHLVASDCNTTIFIHEIEHFDRKLIDIAIRLKATNSHIKLVIFTRSEAALLALSDRIPMYDGVLFKQESLDTLKKALLHVARGKRYLSSRTIALLEQSQIKLTPRESDVLGLILKGQSKREMASSLKLSQETVKSHRKNLMRKFEAKNMTHLINHAQKFKLVS